MVRHLTCSRAPDPPLNEPEATQAIIWIIVMPISWIYTQDFVSGSLLAAIGLAMLVYVPYVTWISLRSRHTSFDCAAREVAYTIISMTTWLATAIWICSFLNTSYHCMDWTKQEMSGSAANATPTPPRCHRVLPGCYFCYLAGDDRLDRPSDSGSPLSSLSDIGRCVVARRSRRKT